MSNSVSLHDRCIWIVDYLRRNEENDERTIRQIWEAAKEPPKHGPDPGGLSDGASLPTYHRTVGKLLRQGQLEEDGELDGATIFRASPHISDLSTFTLTDLNAALWELSVPEAIATYVDAADYYEKHAGKVLQTAARELLDEDPRKLIIRMLRDLADEVSEDVAILSDPNVNDVKHYALAERRLRDLRHFVHSELGINGSAWTMPHFEDAIASGEFVHPVWAHVEEVVNNQVVGDTFVRKIRLTEDDVDNLGPVVAGTDGSSHVGYVRGIPAPSYVEEQGRLLLVFNNSLAYIDLPDEYPEPTVPYHGVPLTRAALVDPQNRGMVLSRPWFEDLTDSQYEHFTKSSLDVVQFRVDDRLMNGTARAYGAKIGTPDGGVLPRPNVLIRDGAVTPQEREFQHYCVRNAYGEMVREGITRSYSILRSVKESNNRVYAGAVKQTQLKTFARIVNWYVKKEVEPNWDLSKVSMVTDTVAATRLINALPELDDPKAYYSTCVICRPFPSMDTGLRTSRMTTTQEWIDYFERRREQQESRWRDRGEAPSWFIRQQVEDDDYVRMCTDADYGSFYFGRPNKDMDLSMPRFEFMDSLRPLSSEERANRVNRSWRMIIAGVHRTKWSLDREHNFLTRRKIPRIVPYVIYRAHEKCKALGHRLERELRQEIVMRLSQLKGMRGMPGSKVDIEPVPASEYLHQMQARLAQEDDELDQDNN